VRYPRGTGEGVDLDSVPLEPLAIGKGQMLREADGELELAVIAIGYSVQPARQAVDILIGEGRKIALMDARFAKPLDESAICDLARRARRIVTVEENTFCGGFGSAVLELLHREEILVPVTVCAGPDEFVHHGAQKIQRREYGLDADGLLYKMRTVLKRKGANQTTKASAVSVGT
jgi:1-deoxy-D-xylulose-5-phosphate synthase